MTGKMWAYEHFNFTPDMVCFGKKTQVCGFAAGPRIDTVKNNVFAEASRINSTWGGNLVDMVRAQRYFEIISEEKLVENARTVGDYLLSKLVRLSEKFPDRLGNARGAGLMCAVDANTTELRDALTKQMFERGAIILKCGNNSLRFRPALTFSKSDVDELLVLLEDSVKAEVS